MRKLPLTSSGAPAHQYPLLQLLRVGIKLEAPHQSSKVPVSGILPLKPFLLTTCSFLPTKVTKLEFPTTPIAHGANSAPIGPQYAAGIISQMSLFWLCGLVFISLTQSEVTWEEGMSVEELPPLNGPVGLSVGKILDFLLIRESSAHCGC